MQYHLMFYYTNLAIAEKASCPEISSYDLTYGTSHKAAALTAAFSSDGECDPLYAINYAFILNFT